MSDTDFGRVQAMFDAWNEGNVDRMIDFWAEDGDWIWEDAPEMPDASVVHGRERVEAHLREMMTLLENVQLSVDEVSRVGGEVLATGTGHLQGAASGIELDAPFAHVIRFEDGRVRRYRTFMTREQALSAVEADSGSAERRP